MRSKWSRRSLTRLDELGELNKNIQVKLVQRVSALESDMTRQAEAMNQLRDYSQRTEENLSRLISGVDKLAKDLPGRLASIRVAAESGASGAGDEILPPLPSLPRRAERKRARQRAMPWVATRKMAIVGGAAFVILARRLRSAKA